MTQERFQRIRDLFTAALERDTGARTAFLEHACRDDPSLIEEVGKLLASHERAGAFLEETATAAAVEDPALPDPYLGKTLSERYRIEKQLGRGGFGVVYLARDTHLHDKPVVVKILLEKLEHNEWFQKKFREECKALARINHPGVVGVLDQGLAPDGKPYLAMDFVRGVTLGEALARGQMELDRVAHLIRQIGQALESAHEQGIYHRDLKPPNIILRDLGGGEELPVIIDFGVATVKDATTTTSGVHPTRVAGSYPYMAPEQYLGRPEAASDIFALGVIAYEMTTGRRPFEADSPVSLFFQQKKGVQVKPADLRPDLPPAAGRVILKALSYEARDRFARPLEFCQALARALLGEADPPDASATTVDGGAPGKQAVVTRRRAMVASLVALAALAVFAIRSGRLPPPLPGAERTLEYFLLVQRYRDGQPFREPFRLGREMIFQADYRIRLVCSSRQPGYLYLINEGPLTAGGLPDFNVLFPTPAANNGSALLRPRQQAQIPPGNEFFVFDEQQGEEKLWMVWSARAAPELEAVKHWVNDQDRGSVRNPAQIQALRDFLAKHSRSRRPRVERDEAAARTILRGRGDLWVHLLPLAHH